MDEFMDMTSRQLHACLEKIGTRKNNEYARTARLHGYDVKVKENADMATAEFSDDEKALIDKTIKAAVKRRVKKNIGG